MIRFFIKNGNNSVKFDAPTDELFDFVNITLHNFLKKNEFFGSPPIFTSLRFVNIGGDPVA